MVCQGSIYRVCLHDIDITSFGYIVENWCKKISFAGEIAVSLENSFSTAQISPICPICPEVENSHSFFNVSYTWYKSLVHIYLNNYNKILIYLTLLYFLLHYLQEYSKIWNIAKSNKSELRNCLSYRGLPYLFEVRSQTFRNDCEISRSQPQNSKSIVIRPQRPQKATVRI
jgi:hypothetical protein